MKCKGVMRKPVEQAQQDCAGSDPQQLGDQASSIPTDTLKWGTRWEMDPAYYQYQACDCLLVSVARINVELVLTSAADLALGGGLLDLKPRAPDALLHMLQGLQAHTY